MDTDRKIQKEGRKVRYRHILQTNPTKNSTNRSTGMTRLLTSYHNFSHFFNVEISLQKYFYLISSKYHAPPPYPPTHTKRENVETMAIFMLYKSSVMKLLQRSQEDHQKNFLRSPSVIPTPPPPPPPPLPSIPPTTNTNNTNKSNKKYYFFKEDWKFPAKILVHLMLTSKSTVFPLGWGGGRKRKKRRKL